MRIGWIGLGKLGLPCALAMESKGHEVFGTDSNPAVGEIIATRNLPYEEAGAQELLNESRVCFEPSIEAVIDRDPDIIFVAVQTPHEYRFEGVTRLPSERADFNYDYLMSAMSEVARLAAAKKKRLIVAVISTVLPGTMEKYIKPLLNEYVALSYSAQFIAMGTCVNDYLNPEFVLVGVDDEEAAKVLEQFYVTITPAPVCRMRVASAELTKVAYNVYLGNKIIFANSIMEMSEKSGADCDEVLSALHLATNRLISSKYMYAGLGDGGGCHGRDQIALSNFAREVDLSYDLFSVAMECREAQTEWLASIAYDEATERHWPILIMGEAYKKGTRLTVGSCSTLLLNILKEWTLDVDTFDAHVNPDAVWPNYPAIYIIATPHDEFKTWIAPEGSVVLDPWGITPKGPGVRHIGRKD